MLARFNDDGIDVGPRRNQAAGHRLGMMLLDPHIGNDDSPLDFPLLVEKAAGESQIPRADADFVTPLCKIDRHGENRFRHGRSKCKGMWQAMAINKANGSRKKC